MDAIIAAVDLGLVAANHFGDETRLQLYFHFSHRLFSFTCLLSVLIFRGCFLHKNKDLYCRVSSHAMLCIRGLPWSRHEEAPPMGETPPDLVASVGAIGREDDRQNILDRLFRFNARVVTIHGVGGSGKTTLAKLVYDVVDVDLKIWIFVSDTLEFQKVIKKILGRQGGGKEEAKLRDRLRGKRFLLVLDDLWSNNRDKFMNLANFLRGCSDGGKIIVTTREQSVVNMIETNMMGTSTYPLNVLSNHNLLLLLKLYAFRETGDIADNLIEIGRQIVGKCAGLPLPVQILGSLLCANREASDWESIRDGNHIELLLRLCRDLPVYCKDRFFHFSPLLEDKHMEEADFTDIWMVHGLFESLDQEMSPVAVEQEISSIIQMQDGDENRAALRDLIGYLKKYQPTQNECLVINGSTGKVGTNVHHLSISCPKFGDDPTGLPKLNGLHSLVLRAATSKFVEKLFSGRFVSKYKLLRMLNLKESFLKSPKCIYSIKSLKCLNLSRNKQIKELPNSILNLACLEILRLDGCSELKTLPKSIKKLSGLKILTLTTRAMELPGGIECLTSLQSLLIRGCQFLTSLPIGLYLSRLTSLQSLTIYTCNELQFIEENVGRNSNNLSLRELRLENLAKMEALPLPLGANINLRLLQIKHCDGLKKLPDSLLQMDLDHIDIEYCFQLGSVPVGLSDLTSLKFFKSVGCPALPDQCRYKAPHHT